MYTRFVVILCVCVSVCVSKGFRFCFPQAALAYARVARATRGDPIYRPLSELEPPRESDEPGEGGTPPTSPRDLHPMYSQRKQPEVGGSCSSLTAPPSSYSLSRREGEVRALSTGGGSSSDLRLPTSIASAFSVETLELAASLASAASVLCAAFAREQPRGAGESAGASIHAESIIHEESM